MTTVRRSACRMLALAALVTLISYGCGGSGGSGSPPPPPPPPPPPTTVDWDLEVETTNVVSPLSPSLVGHYDLSGVLLDYENVPGLIADMSQAGFVAAGGGGADWRIGLGRWENSTEILDTLTDGTTCDNATVENRSSFATDLELLASRDWFSYTDGAPVSSADIVNNRYELGYVRSVIDTAAAFGATPFLSVDLMPRALSVNQIPNRLDCSTTFANSISNNQPANPAVLAEAVTGLVQRVVEGSGTKTGDERPRAVQYWEVWNEPELNIFWEPTLGADPDSFFNMAIATLLELDAYRSATADTNGQAIRIGLGSFVNASSAIATIEGFDPANIPIDFISFHAYNDDPLVIVDAIAQTAMAVQNSTNYQGIELVLAEWGPDLATRAGDQLYAATMDPALHAATVVALGASLGLDRSHNAIFYDFFPVLALGLIDNGGTPRPLYRAYELMAKLTVGNAERLGIMGLADGRLDAGMGAALAAQDAQSGTVRVLLVNRSSNSKTTRVTLNGAAATPTQVFVFDASSDPANSLPSMRTPNATFVLPPRSIAVAEF